MVKVLMTKEDLNLIIKIIRNDIKAKYAMQRISSRLLGTNLLEWDREDKQRADLLKKLEKQTDVGRIIARQDVKP